MMKIETLIRELGNYFGRLAVWFAVVPLTWAGFVAIIDLGQRVGPIWILIPVGLALITYLWDKWRKRK